MSVERARQLRKTMPAPEARLWNALRLLRPLGHHFRRQVPLGRYYADFCCHKSRLIIEIDGDTHFVDAGMAHDAVRDGFIRGQGYRVLRVNNDDEMAKLDGVMTVIVSALNPPPTLSPSPQGGGKPVR